MTLLVKEKPTRTPFVPSNVWRISVARYLEMVEADIFQDDHVELLEGIIVEKMTANPPHADILDLLVSLLARLLPLSYTVGNQRPFLTDDSVPEPDILVYLRIKHSGKHPTSANAPLLIEISDSTLAYDQGRKKRIYARSGLMQYWIVNIPERQIEVYTQPRNGTFSQVRIYSGADQVPVQLNSQQFGSVKLTDLFSIL